jgi:hypothetical protein
MNRATPIPGTVTLHVPFRMVRRGGRKEMQLPAGAMLPRQANTRVTVPLDLRPYHGSPFESRRTTFRRS